jgi:hypothetical protein
MDKFDEERIDIIGQNGNDGDHYHVMDRPQTTKCCPTCGNMYLIQLRTLNKKFCPDCSTEIPWSLDKGQNPLT